MGTCDSNVFPEEAESMLVAKVPPQSDTSPAVIKIALENRLPRFHE